MSVYQLFLSATVAISVCLSVVLVCHCGDICLCLSVVLVCHCGDICLCISCSCLPLWRYLYVYQLFLSATVTLSVDQLFLSATVAISVCLSVVLVCHCVYQLFLSATVAISVCVSVVLVCHCGDICLCISCSCLPLW